MNQETRKLGSFFVKLERNAEDPASVAVTLTDDHPEWLKEAIYDAHDGTGPNDWVYEECLAACDAIDDGSLTCGDDAHEHADGRVDVYTQARFVWAACFCLSSLFAEAEEQAKDGADGIEDVGDHLGRVQYYAIERIARIILDAYAAKEDDSDDEHSGYGQGNEEVS